MLEDLRKSEDPLVKIYCLLGDNVGWSKSNLSAEEFTEYKTDLQRDLRQRHKDAEAAGRPPLTASNLKQAIFEIAADMILNDLPGGRDLERRVYDCFPHATGLPMTFRERIASGRIKRKFLTLGVEEGEGRSNEEPENE
jgi:hypothetical protein